MCSVKYLQLFKHRRFPRTIHFFRSAVHVQTTYNSVETSWNNNAENNTDICENQHDNLTIHNRVNRCLSSTTFELHSWGGGTLSNNAWWCVYVCIQWITTNGKIKISLFRRCPVSTQNCFASESNEKKKITNFLIFNLILIKKFFEINPLREGTITKG